jgi:cytochrome c553
LRGVEIESFGAVPSPRRPVQLTGVSAEIAETRARLREVAPRGHWDAVMAEVARLQSDESMSPLAALQAVYAKLAAGWHPR